MVAFKLPLAILLALAAIDSDSMIGRVAALAPPSSSSSSRPATASSSARPSGTETTTCAVVGVGVLGTSLCRKLIDQGNIHVTGITKTRNRHDEIRAALASPDFNLVCGDDISNDSSSQKAAQYDHVVFCAPPSGFDDYAAAVKDAVDQLWNGKGVFVFTSSGAVYVQHPPRNSRTMKIDSPTFLP
jgi:nucleoside-diphosphate-sugar epimerase